jgi:hypothetical protein
MKTRSLSSDASVVPFFYPSVCRRSFAKSLKHAIIALVMTYRGQVKNGVVEIEGSLRPEDGTLVTVEPVDQDTSLPKPGLPEPGTPAAILNCDAHWHGPPEEVDRLLDVLRRDKWAEVQAQLQTDARTAL